eukprot:115842-Amphidinium_carterae.1
MVPWCAVVPSRVDRIIFVEFNGHHYDRLVVARPETVKTYVAAQDEVGALAGGGKNVGRPISSNLTKRVPSSCAEAIILVQWN